MKLLPENVYNVLMRKTMSRFAFIYDQTRCIGCNTCQIACKDGHNLEKGIWYRKVDTVEYFVHGRNKWKHISHTCRHCSDAACERLCPQGAIRSQEDGAVIIYRDKCNGCGVCISACPYGEIQLSPRLGKAVKCDSCLEERRKGGKPICVEACLTHCLDIRETELTGKTDVKPDSIDEPFGQELTCQKSGDSLLKTSLNRAISKKLKEYSGFFASKEKALSIIRRFSDWEEHKEKDWSLMYDFLFCGTDGDLSLPLWASVSQGEQILLNQTTLEIIQFYHRWGYEPVWMEGNPPDYIGEQLRFLSYLAEVMEPEILQAFQTFLTQYTHNHVKVLQQYMDHCSGIYAGYIRYVHEIREFLSHLLKGREDFLLPVFEESLPSLSSGTSIGQGLYPPISDKPSLIVPTAGINNCGGICVIRPKVQENCILSIETDRESQAPKLRACVRGRGYRKTFLHPGRLRYPMKRIGKRGEGKFERVTWEEAVALLTDQWKRIRDTYGPGSRYVIYGTGVTGIMSPGRLAKRLLALDGGFLDAYNSYSSACVSEMSEYLFGTVESTNSPADLQNTRLLILWGDNSAESIFGSERSNYLSQLKSSGIKIIVIDPRMSQTGVAYADEWYAIKPSTDAALADAMAYVIWSEGLQDQEFMDKYCIGFDEEHMPEGIPKGESYYSYLFGGMDGIEKTPEWGEKITGIEADRIRSLARAYAGIKPACIAAGLGAQRHGNGEQSAKGISMLACLTGNIGIPGGGTGGNASVITEHKRIRLVGNPVENPYPGKIPVFLWTKAISQGIYMTPKEDGLRGMEHLSSNIKMIFCLASNTLVNQHSHINHTTELLKDESKCEFILCSDIFMTPSARYADLLLPATSVLEGENITAPWTGSNYLLKNNPVIPPLFECRFEWEWLKEVAERLGFFQEFTGGKPELGQWLQESYEIFRREEPELPDYEIFCRRGGWKFSEPVCRIAFEAQIQDPKKHPFPTPSGKIEIFSKRLYDMERPEEIPAIPRYIPCPEGPGDPRRKEYPLQLIGWHTRRRCHSIHDNNQWMEEIEAPGLWIHPEDAKARGISDQDLVEVKNSRGCIRMPAVVTRRIRPGVVAMAQGGWYTPDRCGTDIRGSINVLTDDACPTPLAKGNPQHTNLVEICLAKR